MERGTLKLANMCGSLFENSKKKWKKQIRPLVDKFWD